MPSPANERIYRPIQDVGIGLRSPHYSLIEKNLPDIPWFEVLIDNYLGKGGAVRQHLLNIRQDYPMAFHSVSLSLGSTDPLNMPHLKRLKQAMDEFEPSHVSDHLCWSSINGRYCHDLLPLPYTEEAIQHVVERIQRIQDFLGAQILIENVSSYLQYRISELEEWRFLNEIAQRADCLILLDINNVYVSAYNQQFDAVEYLNGLAAQRVREFHLAGYEDKGEYLLDSHSRPVHEPVWALYDLALQRFGPLPTLIEWDNDIPQLEVLLEERQKAQQHLLRFNCDAA